MQQETGLLDSSVIAILGGAAVVSLYPPLAAAGFLMGGCGVFGVYYFFRSWSKFDRLFRNLNLGRGKAFPILKEREETEVSTVYKFTLPAGISSEDFERNRLAIQQHIGRDIDIKYTYKEIWVEVFEQGQKEVYEFELVKCKGRVEFPVGYDRRGRLKTCDLSSGEPHLLIAGETGSGKSTVLRAIITNLILDKGLKLHLIDLKRGAEFQIFAKCKNVASFARTKTEAAQVLNAISKEVDRRYDLFYKHDCVDIKEFNKLWGGMGYELLIIDEFADLQQEKGCIALLEEIAAKARACGIHLIISTQRPDHIILNGRIKANVTTVLGLKTMNEANSRIILDKSGLEFLKGKGQGIFKKGTETLIQCPYLSTENARELLRPMYVQKQEQTQVEVDLLC